MRRAINYFAAILLGIACSAAGGCAQGVDGDPSDLGSGDQDPAAESPAPTDCALDETRIGEPGASLDLGVTTVIVDTWLEKPSDPGTYVGFTLHTSTGEPVVYTVKAGNKVFQADTPTWTNPAGTDGPGVKGINRLSFCAAGP